MRKTALLICSAIIVFSFASVVYFYPALPESMVTHWGISGEPDGYSGKNMAFAFPILTLFFFLLLAWVPKIDPLNENIKKFEDVYDDFLLVFSLFMFYISSLTLIWNLGVEFDMTIAIIPAMSFLFFFIGTMFSSLKRNYTIGVRTPWALSDDRVWDKTNKASGTIFKAIGILSLLTLFAPQYFFWMFLGSTMIGVLAIFIYSYVEYKNIVKDGGNKKGYKKSHDKRE